MPLSRRALTALDARPPRLDTPLLFPAPHTHGLFGCKRYSACCATPALRADEDRQDPELVRVAAYAGLRRGELVALRWRDVDFERRKLVVRRAVSGDVEASSTKSRRAREVPLARQAAGALARLSQRRDFTSADDYVFCNRLGHRLDGSALRRRAAAAPIPRPAAYVRLAPRSRRGRPGIREGRDGPLADHDD